MGTIHILLAAGEAILLFLALDSMHRMTKMENKLQKQIIEKQKMPEENESEYPNQNNVSAIFRKKQEEIAKKEKILEEKDGKAEQEALIDAVLREIFP